MRSLTPTLPTAMGTSVICDGGYRAHRVSSRPEPRGPGCCATGNAGRPGRRGADGCRVHGGIVARGGQRPGHRRPRLGDNLTDGAVPATSPVLVWLELRGF